VEGSFSKIISNANFYYTKERINLGIDFTEKFQFLNKIKSSFIKIVLAILSNLNKLSIQQQTSYHYYKHKNFIPQHLAYLKKGNL